MIGWNREKLIFALSLVVLIGSVVFAAGSFLGSDPTSVPLVEPTPATEGAVGADVAILWYQGGSGDLRDPFQEKSEWRGARPDPLAPPPLGPLARRIPLPVPVARAPSAWPSLEEVPPVSLEEEGE